MTLHSNSIADRFYQVMLGNVYTLSPHRLLLLRGDDVALIAENHNAWGIVEEKDIEIINDFLLNTRIQEIRNFPESIQSLWQAGLLTKNGNEKEDAIKPTEKYPSSLLLKLTGACNIHCDYCYDYHVSRRNSKISFTKIKDSIDFLLSKRDNLGITFHGGEPLMCFDLIKKTVEYVKYTFNSAEKRVSFQIQSNALLLNDTIISFLEENNISVGLSIDGITEESNKFRTDHSGNSILPRFAAILEKHSDFIRSRCGILSVISKANIDHIPDFALWLQEQHINNLSLSFLDAAGLGASIQTEKVRPDEAVNLFRSLIGLVKAGRINKLNVSPIISRISNLFQYNPKDYCHKGPCAAADDFLVLDAKGMYRSCDCIYDPFFEIGREISILNDFSTRKNIVDRHSWLKNEHLGCSKCPIFSFCGGTCAGKAIIANQDSMSVDEIECAISKYVFPELLNEFAYSEKKPLFDYYYRHKKW